MWISYLFRKQVNMVRHGCDNYFFHPPPIFFLTDSSWDEEIGTEMQ